MSLYRLASVGVSLSDPTPRSRFPMRNRNPSRNPGSKRTIPAQDQTDLWIATPGPRSGLQDESGQISSSYSRKSTRQRAGGRSLPDG